MPVQRIIHGLKQNIRFSCHDTLIFLGVFTGAFILCLILQHFSENDSHVPPIFILVVLIISRMTDGYFYGFLSAVVGVVAVNYIFTYPYFELDFTLTGYPLTFVTMLFVSLVTCTMTSRIKTQERFIRENEKEKIRANLLRGISHDIRTPLTGIVGASNVLLESKDLDPQKQQELLRDINNDAQWLIHMVENVLSITRMGTDFNSLHKEPEIVEELLSEVICKFRKQWPQIQVHVMIPDEVFFVPVDAILVEQVMQNILHNSAIHGESCTDIWITAEFTHTEAIFTFADNGCGFHLEGVSSGGQFHTSDMLQERHDYHRNMGIGLSLCETIIKAHQGNIEWENGPDGGAIVRFRLPLKED